MFEDIPPKKGPCKHAQKIFEAAKAKRVNLCELSRATGIARGTFGRWKRGECSPTSKTLDKIWAYLHTRRAERVPRQKPTEETTQCVLEKLS